MTIAWPLPISLNAVQPPRASAGLRVTPATVTVRSLRGIANLMTSPGCIAPFRPSASSTGTHMVDGAAGFCWAATGMAMTKIAVAESDVLKVWLIMRMRVLHDGKPRVKRQYCCSRRRLPMCDPTDTSEHRERRATRRQRPRRQRSQERDTASESKPRYDWPYQALFLGEH